MGSYAKARENMINNQLEPGGISDPRLLAAWAEVPREQFLPEEKKTAAYVDEDILLPGGSFLMEPLVLARMLQVAQIREGDIVLNIGDYTGYSSALLSNLVITIVALKSEPSMFEGARLCWADADFCNIAVIEGEEAEGCARHEPYSLILLNGAVADIPSALKAQLAVGGRLVAVIREGGAQFGTVTVVRRDGADAYSRQRYFDAATPYLRGFAPAPEFTF